MKLIILIGALFFLNSTLWASGTTVGNGGFVLSCPNKVQIFDYYEMEQAGFQIEPIPGKSLDEKVESLLAKLQSVDPNRAKSYRHQYNKIWRYHHENLNIEGLHLNYEESQNPNIQKRFGLGPVSFPKNCELILAVQQASPEYDERNLGLRKPMTVRIYTKVWSRLSLDAQAALVLHELFYREDLIRNTAKTSESTRYLNGFLATVEFNSLDIGSWTSRLESVNISAMFPMFNVAEDSLEVEPDSENIDYVLYGGVLPGYARYPKLKGKIKIKDNMQWEVIPFTKRFYKGIYPKEFLLKQPTIINIIEYSKNNFKLNVDTKCVVTMSSELKVEKIVNNRQCKSFLHEYENTNIKFKGPIGATFIRSIRTDGSAHLFLAATDFSILQVSVEGKWKNISKVDINLNTDEFHYYK